MDCKYGFKISRKGYDPAEVDAYIDEQIARMTAMQEQNAALMRKLSQAQDMIRHYSATEKSLRKSIAESKTGAANLINDARERSTHLVDTAREECNRIVDELDAKIDERYKKLDEIKNNVLRFKQELFNLYSDHIEMVEELANTAENFTYEPDFTTLSEAIDAFEEGAAAVEAPEVPNFPQCPDDGFFEETKEEPAAEEEIAYLSEMDFGFEEADTTEEIPEVEAAPEAEVAEDMFFEIEEDVETEAEAVAEAEKEEATNYFDEIEEPITIAEEDDDGFVELALEDDAPVIADDDDDMFITNKEEVKEKEELFNFLKDFVNGSEE